MEIVPVLRSNPQKAWVRLRELANNLELVQHFRQHVKSLLYLKDDTTSTLLNLKKKIRVTITNTTKSSRM